MSKVWIGTRELAAYLRRLSVVYSHDLRLKIVTQLYMREMSPAMFYAEFGGGSIARVNRHFKKLAEEGWLRYIRKESGDKRRGGVEHFYRATELAVFDHETWSALPYSIKAAFSWRTVVQLGERVVDAMREATFDSRPNRHLSWTPLLLDEMGWKRVIAAVDAFFASIFEEQEDARLRMQRSGEKPMLATIGLLGFESPICKGMKVGPMLAEGMESAIPFMRRLAKVFADELSLRIVAELNLQAMSATEFHREFGGASIRAIRRRFRMLADLGWLTQVDAVKRRGAVEKIYRATGPAVFDNDTWDDLPDSQKGQHSWTAYRQLMDQVAEAIAAGTFDSRNDRHLTWSLVALDEEGWGKVAGAIDALFELILDEASAAEPRLERSAQEPLRMTVGLLAFESPRGTEQEF